MSGMHALTKEMGVTVFPTFVEGFNVLATGGKVRRYKGDIPRISPVALLSAAQGIARHEPHGQDPAGRGALGRAARGPVGRHLGPGLADPGPTCRPGWPAT